MIFEALSVPAGDVRRLLSAANPDAALLYIYLKSENTFENAADQAEFDEFVSTCTRKSLYNTGVDAQYGDKLITLSTCEYSQTNGRLVVVAKMVG